jgi:hypothetical protein
VNRTWQKHRGKHYGTATSEHEYLSHH